MKTALIGLSLSACIAEILTGQTREENVLLIFASNTAQTEDDWRKVMEINAQADDRWREHYDRAVALVNRLRASGKIVQYRKDGGPSISLADGSHWRVVFMQ